MKVPAKTPVKRKQTRKALSVSGKIYEQLTEQAKVEGRDRSPLVEEALLLYFKTKEVLIAVDTETTSIDPRGGPLYKEHRLEKDLNPVKLYPKEPDKDFKPGSKSPVSFKKQDRSKPPVASLPNPTKFF